MRAGRASRRSQGVVTEEGWVVEVRALDCRLAVRSLIREHEVASDNLPRYEGVAEVSGIYQGKHVTGFTMVEMVGNWKA